jgi:hypothetical protein
LSIRVEDAASLSTPLCFRELSLFDPALDGSPTQADTASNLGFTETLFVKGSPLLRAVVALLTTTETGAFITKFWCRLPVFHGNHFGTL